jgi:phage N-6-adenine-methyltransferase
VSPAQKPGKSKQDYETPREFIDAVVRRFGPFAIDLAASEANKKAPTFFGEADDSLSKPWAGLLIEEIDFVGWLNPPFANLDKWAWKCATESKLLHPRAVITMLCPASVGTNWWAEHVDGSAAEVLLLRPRLTFVGCSDPYPKIPRRNTCRISDSQW